MNGFGKECEFFLTVKGVMCSWIDVQSGIWELRYESFDEMKRGPIIYLSMKYQN